MGKYLFHYTHLANAYSILKDEMVILNNVLNCNDKKEKEDHDSTGNDSLYIFCCSRAPLNSGCWSPYSKGIYGVAIKFVFKKESDFKELLTAIDKEYKIESDSIKYVPGNFVYKDDSANKEYLCKNSFFAPEKEYRFYVLFNGYYDAGNTIKAKINKKCLKRIELYVHTKIFSMVSNLYKGNNFIIVKENKCVA